MDTFPWHNFLSGASFPPYLTPPPDKGVGRKFWCHPHIGDAVNNYLDSVWEWCWALRMELTLKLNLSAQSALNSPGLLSIRCLEHHNHIWWLVEMPMLVRIVKLSYDIYPITVSRGPYHMLAVQTQGVLIHFHFHFAVFRSLLLSHLFSWVPWGTKPAHGVPLKIFPHIYLVLYHLHPSSPSLHLQVTRCPVCRFVFHGTPAIRWPANTHLQNFGINLSENWSWHFVKFDAGDHLCFSRNRYIERLAMKYFKLSWLNCWGYHHSLWNFCSIKQKLKPSFAVNVTSDLWFCNQIFELYGFAHKQKA